MISDYGDPSPIAGSASPVKEGSPRNELERSRTSSHDPAAPIVSGEPAASALSSTKHASGPQVEASGPSLAQLLFQARTTQAQLSAQPLSIANRDPMLIQKLFGG